MTDEKTIERRLRREAGKLGALPLKFTSQYHRGMPDRIILLPEGRTVFAEIKTHGKKPTRLQEKAIARLRALGFRCEVVDSEEKLDELMKSLNDEIHTA